MREDGWLKKSLDESRKNVESWPAWKKRLQGIPTPLDKLLSEDHALNPLHGTVIHMQRCVDSLGKCKSDCDGRDDGWQCVRCKAASYIKAIREEGLLTNGYY